MKKVLLSTLLALLCSVKVFACWPSGFTNACFKVVNTVNGPEMEITMITVGSCYNGWLNGGGPYPGHGYLYYRINGTTTDIGYFTPVETSLGGGDYLLTYHIPYGYPMPKEHECIRVHMDMKHEDDVSFVGFPPCTPPDCDQLTNGILVCPCEDRVPCDANFGYCVSYDEANDQYNVTLDVNNNYPWITYHTFFENGPGGQTNSMPATHTYDVGESGTICVTAYYHQGTDSCEICMPYCFGQQYKPGREKKQKPDTRAIGQISTYFSEVKLYPNPANNVTKLEFSLNESEQLTIQMLDISGRIVKTIRNNEQAAPGYHTIEINTADVPSGMYIIRMGTGKTSANYRLSVIK